MCRCRGGGLRFGVETFKGLICCLATIFRISYSYFLSMYKGRAYSFEGILAPYFRKYTIWMKVMVIAIHTLHRL
jgi:hypothetical protein